MTADKLFAMEATQDEILALLKSAARTATQNPGAFEALLLRNFIPRPKATDVAPEDAAVPVPVDLFRDILTAAAGDRVLFDRLYELRWFPSHDEDPS